MAEQLTIRAGEEIGQAIGEIRRARGMSASELAELTGLSRSYIEKIEAGRTTSLIEHELRILRRLGARVAVDLSVASG
jgi:transcriptional regulator with XRE-family HTH domain